MKGTIRAYSLQLLRPPYSSTPQPQTMKAKPGAILPLAHAALHTRHTDFRSSPFILTRVPFFLVLKAHVTQDSVINPPGKQDAEP